MTVGPILVEINPTWGTKERYKSFDKLDWLQHHRFIPQEKNSISIGHSLSPVFETVIPEGVVARHALTKQVELNTNVIRLLLKKLTHKVPPRDERILGVSVLVTKQWRRVQDKRKRRSRGRRSILFRKTIVCSCFGCLSPRTRHNINTLTDAAHITWPTPAHGRVHWHASRAGCGRLEAARSVHRPAFQW
jgi:hypothetical protein